MPTHIAARILLIDNEPDTAQAIGRIPGLWIDQVQTPAQGHQALAEDSYVFAIVDVALPGCVGIQLIRGLRNRYPEIPLLVITREESVYVAAECLLAGVVDCLMKDAEPAALRRRVERLLAGNFPPPFDPLVVPEERVGHSIAGYRLERVLGYGAFGVVFEATDKETGYPYAMKLLRRPSGPQPRINRLVPRFMQEAEVAMSIKHANTVRVLEYGLGGNPVVPFILYERVDGKTLNEAMAKRRKPIPVRARYIAELAAGLAALHRAKVVHRDVKPQNILLTRSGEIKLTDFGAVEDLAGPRPAFGVRGTVPYRAPEAFHVKQVNDRADIFSLGVVAYELFTGVHPFLRTTAEETARAIQYDEPPTPAAYSDKIPPAIADLLLRMLDKLPQHRPSAEVVTEEISRSLQNAWG